MKNQGSTYLGIVSAVFLFVTISADGVIIEAGVFDQSDPFTPPRRDIAPIVLIEVFAKESYIKMRVTFSTQRCIISHIFKAGGCRV